MKYSAIYVVIFLILLSFMYCYEKTNNKAVSCFCYISVFYVLVLFMSLRYNVGADYLNYTNFIQQGIDNKNYNVFEVGWIPIIFIIDKLNLNVHFFFILTSFISTALMLEIFEKKNATVAISLYLCLGYIEEFSITRQCFAATIYAFCLSRYLKTNKISNLFLGTIISGLFHTSLYLTGILLPIAIILNKKEKKWTNTKSVIVFLTVLIFFKIINLYSLIFNIISYTPYAVYAKMGDSLIGKTVKGTGIGLLLRYSILFGCIFEANRNYKKNPYTKSDHMKIIIIIILLFLFLLSEQIKIFMRLPLIFNTSLCCLYMDKKGRIGKIQKICIILACFLLYFFTVIKSTRDIEGSWKLIPYYTIFETNILG